MVQMDRMCLTVFLLPFYPYNGLYNKRQDIGRKCITFSPVVLPFVLQKFICKGGFLCNIGINIGVLGAFAPDKIGNALRFPYLAVFI